MRTSLPLILASITLAGAQALAAPTLINGAGATFPYPLYSKWFAEYSKSHPDVQINYQSIGSGGGIRQLLEGTVDFGASDTPMTDEQLAKAKTPIIHIPTALGAVVLTYNIPGVSQPLKLSGELVADIFLGKLEKWNDPRIAKLNAGVTLPDQAILVAHRSDGSGTTAIFTDYLAKVSSDWKSKVGAGTAVHWPAGLGGKGNEGVTGLVKQTPGSIAYVELIYADTNKLPIAELQNGTGSFVMPSPKTVTAAAAASVKSIPADFRTSITNAPGKEAYPISSYTYLLIPQQLAGGQKAKSLIAFLNWAITDGQKYNEPLAYATLPKALVAKVAAKIKTIQVR